MDLLKADYIWPPYPAPNLWVQTGFRWDEPRMNLLWLINPVVDAEHDRAWAGDALSTLIDAEFSHEVRLICQGPPKQAVDPLWDELPEGVLDLVPNWQMVKARAEQAHSRLFSKQTPNVVFMDFRRKVMVA